MAETPRIVRAALNPAFINWNATLPYGLTVEEVANGVEKVYEFFFEINNLLVGKELTRLEDMLLGNTLSGMISEVVVKSVSSVASTVVRNERVGGHPDLVPRGKYPGDSVLRGDVGIEVKSSKASGGWQAHNPENTEVIVFRYTLGTSTDLAHSRIPVTFVQILAARLEESDWSLAERGETSRRTRTVSMNEAGVHKLRMNPVYQDPEYCVGRGPQLNAYRGLNASFGRRR